jgi:hypothetical protein
MLMTTRGGNDPVALNPVQERALSAWVGALTSTMPVGTRKILSDSGLIVFDGCQWVLTELGRRAAVERSAQYPTSVARVLR